MTCTLVKIAVYLADDVCTVRHLWKASEHQQDYQACPYHQLQDSSEKHKLIEKKNQ